MQIIFNGTTTQSIVNGTKAVFHYSGCDLKIAADFMREVANSQHGGTFTLPEITNKGHGNINKLLEDLKQHGYNVMITQKNLHTMLHDALSLAVKQHEYQIAAKLNNILVDHFTT